MSVLFSEKFNISELVVTGTTTGPTGYDHVVRNFIKQFVKCGVKIQHVPMMWSNQKIDLPEKDKALFDALEKNTLGDANISLNFCLPEQVKLSNFRLNILYTMFEADRIPENWVKMSHMIDLTMVPTEACRRAWIGSGVNPNTVAVVNLGADTEIYNPNVKPLEFFDEKGKNIVEMYENRFINVQEVTERKNLMGVVKAWMKASSTGEMGNSCLILKLNSYTGDRLRDVLGKIKELKKETPSSAPIYLFTKVLSEAMMPSFYACGTHYFSMSYGEGWDLPATHMGAMGKTLIVPNSTGYTEYLTDDNAYLVDIEKEVNADEKIVTKRLYAGAKWYQPSVEDAIIKLKTSVGDKSKGAILRDTLKTNYTWEIAANNLLKTLSSCVSTSRILMKREKKNVIIACRSMQSQCGIADYSTQLVNHLRNKIPMIYVGGLDFGYLEQIDKAKAAIVHIQHEYSFWSATRLEYFLIQLQKRGCKIILTQHTVNPEAYIHNKIILKYVDKIIVHSNFASIQLRALGCEPSKIKVINMGCFPVLTSEKLDTISTTDEFKNLSEKLAERYVVGFFGFSYFHKGLDRMLVALNHLRNKHQKLFLLALSNKPTRDLYNSFENCNMIADQLGLGPDNMLWIKDYLPEPQLLKMLSLSDMIVLPYSEYGGYGTSLAARTCLSLPIPLATTNISFFADIPSIKIHTGLEEFISSAIDGKAFDPSMQINIQRNFAEEHSWEHMAKAHLGLYEKI